MEMEKAIINSDFLLNPGQLEQNEDSHLFLCSQLKTIYLSLTNQEKAYKNNSNSNSDEDKFIGAHPISLNRSNLNNLFQDDYLICEKTDGVRYFLLFLNNGKVFLHGRSLKKNEGDQYKNQLQFFAANIKIPINFKENENEWKIKYLFDGELVIDTYENIKRIKFFIFDTLIYNYLEVFKGSYYTRLEFSRKFLYFLKSSKNLIKKSQKVLNKFLPFNENSPKIKISQKDFFSLYHCSFLMDCYFKHLAHKQDGLVFTKNNSPYKPGKNTDILKWKDISQQTIDFLMTKNEYFNSSNIFKGAFTNRVLDIYLIGYNKEYNTSDRVLFDFMVVDVEKYDLVEKEIQKLQEVSDSTVFGIIAECKFNKALENHLIKSAHSENQSNFSENLRQKATFNQEPNENYRKSFEENMNYYVSNNFKGGWEIYGWRFDKSDPNALDTGKSIMFGIRDPIDKNELLKMIDKHFQLPEMPPQKKVKT